MPPQDALSLPVASLADFEPVADALIDKLILTCEMTFSGPATGGAAGVRSSLVSARLLHAGSQRKAKVTFRWTCPSSHEPLHLDGSLTMVDGPQGIVLAAGGSHLGISPLRLLHDQVKPVCGAGLDGGKNVVGPPESDRPQLLGLQLATVSGLIDAFVQACRSASGSPVEIRLRVREAEFNRDLPRPDAVQLAHRLASERNPWYRVGWARHYPAAPDHAHDGNYVTVTWRNDRADAPIRMKFYAKTAELLRTEICLDKREAVLEFVRVAKIDWPTDPASNGIGVASQLSILARAAVPLLDAMSAHVALLDAPQREVLDLMIALAPLMRAAAPPPPRREGGALPAAGARPMRRLGPEEQQYRENSPPPDRGGGRTDRGVPRAGASIYCTAQLRRGARCPAARALAGRWSWRAGPAEAAFRRPTDALRQSRFSASRRTGRRKADVSETNRPGDSAIDAVTRPSWNWCVMAQTLSEMDAFR
jgi:hypothetical protein